MLALTYFSFGQGWLLYISDLLLSPSIKEQIMQGFIYK